MNGTFQKSTFTLLLLLGCINAKSQDLSINQKPVLQTRTGEIRISLENITMPAPGEKMGLAGFNYLLDFSHFFYGGIAGYGALTGERGGFLTGGFEGGAHTSILNHLWVDTGLFLGGGGGGAAAQGGGLMLRPHFGFFYEFSNYRLGLQYSKVKFPDGEINSDQISLSIEIPFTSLYTNSPDRANQTYSFGEITDQTPSEIKNRLGHTNETFTLTSQFYFPKSDSLTTRGQPQNGTMGLIGIEFRHDLDDRIYFLIRPAGAMGGNTDGYAELFFGGGYIYPLPYFDRIALSASLSAGSAGGGNVDTGGGAVIKANAGLDYSLTRHVFLEIEAGYIKATGGSFSAPALGFKAGYDMESLTYGRIISPIQPEDQIRLTGWRLRPSHQTYLSPQRKSPDTSKENVNLIGLKGDRVLSQSFFLTGQALSAYNGRAGGYSAGLIGAGWESPPVFGTKNQFNAEILIGAGGGGGLSVGGGAIVEPMFGLKHRFTQNLSAEIMGGRVKAIGGDLNSAIIDFGLVYHLTGLEMSR
jgi:hypothetical protein